MAIKNIRSAVGAIITQNDEVLLVHKVKAMDVYKEATEIAGSWDFPKGGVLPSEATLEEALMRELKEETGSTQYRIERKFEEIINFDFPKGNKYDAQETVMYHVIYTGDRSEIKVQDEELDAIQFVPYESVLNTIELEETKEFYKNVFNKQEKL